MPFFFQMKNILFWIKNTLACGPVCVSLPLGTLWGCSRICFHRHSTIKINETICIIVVPAQKPFSFASMYHVQFTPANNIFEKKDKRSCTAQLWWERGISHLMFISYKYVMAFCLSILQCKLKPCRKINRDCTSKRRQWQEMSVYSHIPLETINPVF